MKKQMRKHWDFILLTLFMSLYAITFSYFSILKHNAFFSGFDLANMDQTIWNTLNGYFFELSRKDTILSRFSIHADLILVLIAPLYLIWNDVRMLLITQSTVLALGALPTYLLSLKVLKSKIISLIIALVFLLNSTMQWANLYDFHGVVLAITFRITAFYFAYMGKWKKFAIFVLLSLLTKESVALNIAILGLIVAFVFKKRNIGIVTFVLSMLWFISSVFFIIPYFSQTLSQNQHWAFKWFQFSSETEEIVPGVQLPTASLVFNRFFLAPDAIPYYYSLLKPFAFLPLLGFPWLILGVPTLTINMLSSHAQMRGGMLHYNSGIISALIVSTIFGIYYLKILIGKNRELAKYTKQIQFGVGIFLLLVALRANYGSSPLPYNPNHFPPMFEKNADDRAFREILKTIPATASITSSPEIRPHLTHRRYAFTVPSATTSAEYIALIDQNRLVGDTKPKGFENELIRSLSESNTHDLISQRGHFYLFKRK